MLSVRQICVKRGKSLILNEVSFCLAAGKTLAVIGESGAGKSTLVAAILGLVRPVSGTINWNKQPVKACQPALVMQEPRSAFNPRLKIRQSVLEPIVARGYPVPSDRLERLCNKLEMPLDLLDRYPDEVSIGQAQRAGIIRALIATPPLVLLDEPLSALDAVTQKCTAKLIKDLQTEEGFAALIVTHDLGYAAAYSDDIAVLKNGQIEEISTASDFISKPTSQYGRTLLGAAVSLGALEIIG